MKRFWDKVITGYGGECHQWVGAKTTDGYGSFFLHRVDGKTTTILAHRFAWELENGPIPEGACVLHRCDNPGCVRLSHLWIGTHHDNMKDCASKGRSAKPKGSNHFRSKLTEGDIYPIRLMRGEGWLLTEIARLYGVTIGTIFSVARGRTWKHVA